MATGELQIWDMVALRAADLSEVLVRADNDHHLARPAFLMVRNESRRARQVQIRAAGMEASASVPGASARPTPRHPFAQEPTDLVIGPVDAGPITYLPSTQGLRVVAYEYREEQGDGESHNVGTG